MTTTIVIPGYTCAMKTAISVPDALFHEVERRLSEIGMNRSEFYATAARRFLDDLDGESLTAEINAALEVINADPVARAQYERERAEWRDFAQRRHRELTEGEEW
jgi:metal-responsive CopG/Arc/MetJ family transcriptional regulator